VVDHPVVRNGVQPSREPRCGLIRGARLDHPHPDLLVELLGGSAALDAAQDKAEKACTVAGIERLEGPAIPATIGEHELFVRGLRHSWRVYRAGSGTNPGKGNGCSAKDGWSWMIP